MMEFGAPIFVLLVLAAVGALVLGGLVLSVVLLVNEKTRVAGIVLLLLILVGVPIAGVGVAFLAVPVARFSSPPRPAVYFESQVETQDIAPALEPEAADASNEDVPPPDATKPDTAKPDATKPDDDAGALWLPRRSALRQQNT